EARSSCADLPITGCGTKTARARGMPLTRATDRTTRSNTLVWIATVGTPYLPSMVIACTATAGAHVLQWPTPTMAASPLDLIFSHVSGSSRVYTDDSWISSVLTPGRCSSNQVC